MAVAIVPVLVITNAKSKLIITNKVVSVMQTNWNRTQFISRNNRGNAVRNDRTSLFTDMVLFKNLKFFDLELDMNFNWNKWMETIDFKTFNGNITYVYFYSIWY